MSYNRSWQDSEGSSLVEFTVTLPLFMPLIFGMVQAGLILYTQAGLQHGAEVAARCASVNYSANQLSLSTSCFPQAPSAVTIANIQAYAAANCYGIPAACASANYTVTAKPTSGACSAYPSYQVTASYPYSVIRYLFHFTLTATSCFPINVS
jgi:Flp pilus assembly protein TadG